MGDPTPGKAGVQYTIIKKDDPDFAASPLAVKKGGAVPMVADYKIGQEFVNPKGMPSGPGFQPGDPAAGGRRKHKKTTRTYPRGILRKTHRIVASKNPTKAPPTRKRAVLIVSEKKLKEARKTAKQRAVKTDIGTIRKKLIEKGIISPDKKNIPPSVLRTLYADSVGAGLIN